MKLVKQYVIDVSVSLRIHQKTYLPSEFVNTMMGLMDEIILIKILFGVQSAIKI